MFSEGIMKKTKVICFANNKGGSGKSTTCASLGYAFAARGKKVLLIDGDMQLNLTLSYFDEDKALEIAAGDKNIYVALREQKPLDGYIYKTDYENVDLIPSSTLMSSIEFDLFGKWQRELILKKLLRPVMNVLCASHKLILPVEASPWGLFGLANMFDFVGQVKEISPSLELAGIVVTKVDSRKNYFKQTMETLRDTKGINVFDTVIHLDSSVEWAQDNSKPVGAFKRSARSATEYGALADELIEKL